MDSLSLEEHTFTAQILNGGSQASDIHAEYHGMQLDMDTTYRVSFDAECSGVSSLDADFEVGVLKTTGVIGESFAKESYIFNNTSQHFEFEFTPQNSNADSVYSFGVFYLGGEGEYTVTISDFTVVPTDIAETIQGDVNMDGEFNAADVVLLQKWLLAVPDTHLRNHIYEKRY